MERKSISFCPIFLPIFIPKELFYWVQEEIMRRSSMCKAAVTRKKKRLAENYEQRVKDMDAFIKGSTCQIPEFDNDLVRRLIASIKVVSAEKLIIQFQS